MKKLTEKLLFLTWIILVIITIALNYANLAVYGAQYFAGFIFGELLIVAFLFWIAEKIYLKLK